MKQGTPTQPWPTGPRRSALRRLGGGALAALLPWRALAAAPRAGDPVVWPEVTLLDGSRWGAEQARGKAVVVVFWSTTCPFCLRHNKHVEKLRRAAVASGRALEIITVAREKDPATVRRYLALHGHGFAVTLDQVAMAEALGARKVIPLTVTVDRQGRLRQTIPGEMFEEDVMELLGPA